MCLCCLSEYLSSEKLIPLGEASEDGLASESFSIVRRVAADGVAFQTSASLRLWYVVPSFVAG